MMLIMLFNYYSNINTFFASSIIIYTSFLAFFTIFQLQFSGFFDLFLPTSGFVSWNLFTTRVINCWQFVNLFNAINYCCSRWITSFFFKGKSWIDLKRIKHRKASEYFSRNYIPNRRKQNCSWNSEHSAFLKFSNAFCYIIVNIKCTYISFLPIRLEYFWIIFTE